MSLAHTARRIACLQPSATVILEAVGELGRVVACTRYCADVVPEVSDGSRTILADSWTADTAQIVAARPDLVIAAVPYQEKAVAEILKAGARFLGLAPKTLADIYTDIATIAGAVGASDRGEAVIAAMQRRIEADSRSSGKSCAAEGLLRGMGQAGHRLAAVGRRTRRTLPAAPSWAIPVARRQSEELVRLDPEVIVAAPGAAPATVCRWRKLSRTVAGRGSRPHSRAASFAFATNSLTLPRRRCFRVSTRWHSPSIQNCFLARKEFGRLLRFQLPQVRNSRSELRFCHGSSHPNRRSAQRDHSTG